MLKAAVAFLAAVLIGRFAITPLFRVLSQSRNEEINILRGLGLIIMILGVLAFLAIYGSLLPSSRFERRQL